MGLKIYLYADKGNTKAVQACEWLKELYSDQVTDMDQADVIVALGGDGTTLDALRLGLKHRKKVYGMNLGHVGAYQNKFMKDRLIERICAAHEVTLNPLSVQAIINDKVVKGYAWNEVYVRSGDNPQQAHLVGIASVLDKPFCVNGDGYLLSTPMGSYAYNYNAGGHRLHFREKLLASTSIVSSVGVKDILPANTNVHITVQDPIKRSVSLMVDNIRLGCITSCDIFQDFSKSVTLLWDAEKINEVDKKGQDIIQKRSDRVKEALDKFGYYHNQFKR